MKDRMHRQNPIRSPPLTERPSSPIFLPLFTNSDQLCVAPVRLVTRALSFAVTTPTRPSSPRTPLAADTTTRPACCRLRPDDVNCPPDKSQHCDISGERQANDSCQRITRLSSTRSETTPATRAQLSITTPIRHCCPSRNVAYVPIPTTTELLRQHVS